MQQQDFSLAPGSMFGCLLWYGLRAAWDDVHTRRSLARRSLEQTSTPRATRGIGNATRLGASGGVGWL